MKADLFPYLLESGACLALLYLLYWLLLRKETFFAFNRAFILLAISLSIALPFIKLPVADTPLSGIPVLFAPTVAVTAPVPAASRDWLAIAFWSYFGIAACFAGHLLFQLLRLTRLAYRLPSVPTSTYRLIETEGRLPTFSFFRWLFWNDQASLSDESQAQILRHELSHIRQWHSADMVFVELVRAVFWFHPAIYLFKKDLQEVHEYLADRDAVRESSVESYVQLMARQLLQQFGFSFIQPFSQFQFNKRMHMLQLSQRTRPALWKSAASILIVSFIAIGYACRPTDMVEPSSPANTQALMSTLNQYIARYPNLSTTLDLYQKPDVPATKAATKMPPYTIKAQVSGVSSAEDQQKIQNLIEKVFTADGKLPSNDENELMVKLNVKTMNVHKNGDGLSFKTGDEPNEAVHLPNETQVYTVVEQMPEFPGGVEAMMKYLGENVHYPKEALERQKVGTVFVQFIVNPDGSISNAQTLKGAEGFNEEAIRVIQTMPSWKPGKQNGKAVPVKYVLPIKFAL
jgi:TonB family protein